MKAFLLKILNFFRPADSVPPAPNRAERRLRQAIARKQRGKQHELP